MANSKKNKSIRVLIPNDNQSEDSILIALDYADEICKSSEGAVKEAILFVPGKESVRFSTLSSALGTQNTKILHSGGLVLLPSGVPMYLKTVRTLKWIKTSSVLISVYSDQKMLDKVDSFDNLYGIVAVPYIPDALEEWQRTWSPIVYGAPTPIPQKLINDPIIEQALTSLTNTINLSNQTLHPSDKDRVNRFLRILRVNDHTEKPSNLKSWAIKNGWDSKTADELEKLAIKTFSLKSKPKIPDTNEAKKTYDYWCSKI